MLSKLICIPETYKAPNERHDAIMNDLEKSQLMAQEKSLAAASNQEG